MNETFSNHYSKILRKILLNWLFWIFISAWKSHRNVIDFVVDFFVGDGVTTVGCFRRDVSLQLLLLGVPAVPAVAATALRALRPQHERLDCATSPHHTTLIGRLFCNGGCNWLDLVLFTSGLQGWSAQSVKLFLHQFQLILQIVLSPTAALYWFPSKPGDYRSNTARNSPNYPVLSLQTSVCYSLCSQARLLMHFLISESHSPQMRITFMLPPCATLSIFASQ